MLARALRIRRGLPPLLAIQTPPRLLQLVPPRPLLIRAQAFGGTGRRERKQRRWADEEGDELTVIDVDFGRPHEWYVRCDR